MIMNRQKFLLTFTAGLAAVAASAQQHLVGGGCDGCELIYEGMPRQLSNTSYLPDWNEGGQKMIVEGRVLKKDKHTPAAGIIVYIYHTDVKGHYSPAPGQVNGRRHGHIRGWIKTGSDGTYRFYTTMPVAYPGKDIPAHIHPIIKEPGINEYYIDEFLFDNDLLLTAGLRRRAENRGGPGIVKLTKDSNGWLMCRRDIVLGLNIPGYR
jgi:protocatechuate 3,4-dioxygenase beta subunit